MSDAFTMKLPALPPHLAIGETGSLPRILAFDLATQFGFAFGVPGLNPISGSRYFTHNGLEPKSESNHARLFANVQRTVELMYTLYRPTAVAYELPPPPHAMKGRTNHTVFKVLHGIPANVEGTFFRYGIFRFFTPTVDQIRKHFIGAAKLQGDVAKARIKKHCDALGWIDTRNEPDISFDRTDALAVWSLAEHFNSPRLAQHVDPVSVAARQAGSGRLL